MNKLTGVDLPFVVTATWGKRSAPRLSSQIKGEFSSEWQATKLVQRLVNDKRNSKSGYKDAAKGLVITGLPPLKGAATIATLHVSNQQINNNRAVLNIEDNTRIKRNIKL